MRVDLFCICGTGAEGEVAPEAAAETFRKFWYQIHTGPGHADCDRATARAAFAAKEKASSEC